MRKKILLTLLILFALLALAAVLYFFVIDDVVVLQDSAFELMYPRKAMLKFRFELLKKFKALTVHTVTIDTLTDSALLEAELKKYSDKKIVLMTPAVTAAIKTKGLIVSEIIEGLSIGISDKESNLFDLILVSDSSSAYEEVNEKALKATDYRDYLYSDPDTFDTIICPDFVLSVIPLLKTEKGSLETGVLYYGCFIL